MLIPLLQAWSLPFRAVYAASEHVTGMAVKVWPCEASDAKNTRDTYMHNISSAGIDLQDTNSDLQANVAGALQSICFQKSGRAAVRGTEAAAHLCSLLSSGNARVTMRAAGALHNVSTDADAIRSIRRCGRACPCCVQLPTLCSCSLHNVNQ